MNKKLLISNIALPVLLAAVFGTVQFTHADNVNVGVNAGLSLGQHPEVRAVVQGAAMINHGQGIFGTVTAVNGTTITVQSQMPPRRDGDDNDENKPAPTPVTYTVNASNATVSKNNATGSVSSIAVGDHIFVAGTVSGTTVTATKITDGPLTQRVGDMMKNNPNIMADFKGNGQPVVGGKVTAVSGNTITISNSSNVSYTIDASSAKILKGKTTSTVSAISVGDEVLAQGTINGSAVTATTVVDAKAVANTANSSNSERAHVGIFAKIGSFFKGIFGF